MRSNRPQRLYGVFWTEDRPDGRLGVQMWGLERNGKHARRYARRVRGLCLSMLLPGPEYRLWDAPTFRHCADRVEGDWR